MFGSTVAIAGRSTPGMVDPFDVVHHLTVPEPEDTIAMQLHIRGPFVVPLMLLDVRAAIHFDDQLLARSAEVRDIRADGMLLPKADALLAQHAQVRPQLALRRSQFLAKLPGAVEHGRIGAARRHGAIVKPYPPLRGTLPKC